MCQLNHKSVQISEFVQINEAHSFLQGVLFNYSNRTYTTQIKRSLYDKIRAVTYTVQIIEGSDNRGSTVLVCKSIANMCTQLVDQNA